MTNLFALTRQEMESETRIMKIVLHTLMSQIFDDAREKIFSSKILQTPSIGRLAKFYR